MKISFDLDGVITDGASWFFSLCEAIEQLQPYDDGVKEARLRYYATCQLKYNPQLFLSRLDEGFIITARKTEAREITNYWLRQHGIILPTFTIEGADDIDWSDYQSASIEVAKRKLAIIRHLYVEVHFDNNVYIVNMLRTLAPDLRVILVS